MTATVSYIVPVWNKFDFLEDCITSILHQSVADFEIIFIDDASSDGSKGLIESLRVPNSRIITNSTNLGPGPSRNIGLSAATGTFIRFVDADDILPEGSTRALIDACTLSSCPGARGNIALFHTSHPEHHEVVFPVSATHRAPFWSIAGMELPWFFTSYVFRREYLEAHGHNFPDLRYGEDPVFLARFLCEVQHVSTIDAITYLVRSRQGREPTYSYVQIADYLRHLGMVSDEFMWHGHRDLAKVYLERGRGDLNGMIYSSDLAPDDRDRISAKSAQIISASMARLTAVDSTMQDLTTIIVTKDSAPHIGIVLEHFKRLGVVPRVFVDAKTTDSTFTICKAAGAQTEIIENPFGRVEPLIEKVAHLCDTDWILRFDDDELPSRQMLETAISLVRNPQHGQYAFKLVHGILNARNGIDALRFYEIPPNGPHFQWRLFNRRVTQFRDTIHTPGFFVNDGVHCSDTDLFVHIQWIVKSYAQRQRKIQLYDSQQDGAGTSWLDYYLIEDNAEALATAYPLEGDEFSEVVADLSARFAQSPRKLSALLGRLRTSPEFRDRAVRLAEEDRGNYPSELTAMTSIAAKVGCTTETLHRWSSEEASRRAGPAVAAANDRERIEALEREVEELRRSNEILRKASAYFVQAQLDRNSKL